MHGTSWAATTCVVFLTGCDTRDGVAALGEKASDEAAHQLEQAHSLVDCLEEAEIAAKVVALPDARGRVEFSGAEPHMVCWADGECRTDVSTVSGGAATAALDRFMEMASDREQREQGSNREVLFLGSRDMSEEWRTCLDTSGYEEPTESIDSREELLEKQAVTAVTNDWIACARERGLLSIPDLSPPVADGFNTYPMALLPPTMTEDQVKELVDACPVFDIEAHREEIEGGEEPEHGWAGQSKVLDPSVGWDAPGWHSGGDDPTDVDDPALDEAIGRLNDILWADQAEFWAEQRR
ncbi:MAG: hypothetical protein LBJ02_07780 [Bifidobacteriaceae bacterium]|nr:hypothetical protein [Bifidobacteriaceae bacterium]